ncbi:hypothetical protein KNP65_06785 [Latilactobacillus curvatus]|uniref:hypothetical protein n=1 Tax=Latilactobacillus curvatus TaxID=28038 RepID=UPI0024114895|nr:hypothetical protein [Latilactobacillus curvatus]MDG2979650.1 hypothetical protein [Latilactobacillus curvatus]
MGQVIQLEQQDNQLAELIAEKLAKKLTAHVDDKLAELFDEKINNDDTMDKKTMCREIFHTTPKTFDDEINSVDFPFIEKTSGRKLYSRKAVNKWIDEHQRTIGGLIR